MTQNKAVQAAIQKVDPFEVRRILFLKGDYSFIVTAKNEHGVLCTHQKQKEALEILTSGKYTQFLYGGAAGGAKSWTGCVWLLFMAASYPKTRWYIARNRLKDLEDSVLVTWKKVCDTYGFHDYKYNGQKHFLTLGNGSVVNFIEIKFQPSDPLFEDVGSTEYTGGWIEEVGEVHQRGASVLDSRTGRHLNSKYGIRKMNFYTCNPKKNWAKTEFYDKDKNGTIEGYKKFMQALPKDNPFIPDEYIETLKQLKSTEPSLYKRLYEGNWDYEDNPNQLTDDEMIEQIFDNTHVPYGKGYITADIARFGSDKAIIGVWKGWRLVDVVVFNVSSTTDIQLAIRTLQHKYRISKNRVVADEDGVGGGVVDNLRIKGFVNNSRAIKEQGKDQQYRNLQVQCLYKLAEIVNEGSIHIEADLTSTQKKEIREELQEIQSKNADNRKLDCKTKSEIKDSIGRSPDWRDMMLMRVYFELKGTKRYAKSRPRDTI